MWSAGAFRINSGSEDGVEIEAHGKVSFEDLADNIVGKRCYLLQKCLDIHPFFEGITNGTATIRCLNLIRNGKLEVPFAMLKLPTGENVADNFWRSGNLLCLLDPSMGKIRNIISKEATSLVHHEHLPGSDRVLIGECLPDWSELQLLNQQVALLHSENRFGSTDIALTPDGPVVVEVNNGCAFELVQMATGQGFFTDEILSFFEECNVKL